MFSFQQRRLPPNHLARNFTERSCPAHFHRILEFSHQFTNKTTYASLAAAINSIDKRSGNKDGIGAQGKSLENINAGTDPAVNKDSAVAAHSSRDFRQDFGRSRALGQDASPVVGNDDSRSARLGGAAASITPAKQARLTLAAEHYLQTMSSVPPCRFDAVLFDGAQPPRWVQNII